MYSLLRLLGASLLVLAFAGCGPQQPSFKNTDLTGADCCRDFRLTDHNGKTRTLADFRGKAVVIFFGYTQCPDVCPTTMLEMALIAACFVLLRGNSSAGELLSLTYIGGLVAQLAPMLLVAYITTMFSADIRFGLNRARLLSETDDLTGIYNMRGFAIIVGRLFDQAVRYNRPVSLLMIDSDNLKAVNDLYGHEAGNRLLKMVAKCIETELRHTDVLARYGGDEFVALLPETAAARALEVAGRILKAVATAPLEFEGRRIETSVSIGLASYPEDGRSIDAIQGRADRAMYLAKEQGRNRVVKFAA